MKKTYMTPELFITLIDNVLMQVASDGESIDTGGDGTETGDGIDAASKLITLDFETGDEDEL